MLSVNNFYIIKKLLKNLPIDGSDIKLILVEGKSRCSSFTFIITAIVIACVVIYY